MDLLVVIRSADPLKLARFYGAFGLVFDLERHGVGPEHMACRIGNSVLEIYPRASEADSTAATRLGFRVPDVEAACALAFSSGGSLM